MAPLNSSLSEQRFPRPLHPIADFEWILTRQVLLSIVTICLEGRHASLVWKTLMGIERTTVTIV